MASIDINKIVDEIVTEAREEFDRFVFETIAPYCEEVTKMEITKADLEEALTVWKYYKEGAFERKTGKWVRLENGADGCNQCWTNDFGWARFNYCPHCGAKMEGAEE